MTDCVIIGNGPSLKEFDFSRLDGWTTFGSNMIYLSGYLPTYYAVEDFLVINDRGVEINERTRGTVRYCPEGYKAILTDDDWIRLSPDAYPIGFTVTALLLRLAYEAHFTRAYLIGVDHRYTLPEHIIDTSFQERLTSIGDDPDHFTPDYFGPGRRLHHPNLPRMEAAYQRALQRWTKAGKEIINLTPGTALKVFATDRMSKYL